MKTGTDPETFYQFFVVWDVNIFIPNILNI